MNKETVGKIVSVSKQWWLKVNKKPVRALGTDGAVYPSIVKVSYTVDGTEYTKRKWFGAGYPVPAVGSSVTVMYDSNKPNKAKF